MQTLVNPSDIREFPTQLSFRKWLEKNHELEAGIWIRFYKKASKIESVDYKQALDEALCFGWIDSLKKKYDDISFLQKFSPRRKRSLWSQVNIGHIERLIKEKKMTEFGLAEVERAKADGRWEAAYHPPSKAEIPDDLQKIIDKDPKMKTFVSTLNKANIYAITWRLATAKKPETREKRLREIVEMLKEERKFH